MKTDHFIALPLAFAFIGALFFAYHHSIIMIHWPTRGSDHKNRPSVTKKRVDLTYWHEGSWIKEQETILWPDDTAQALEYLINNWLALVMRETETGKKITAQVILAPSGQELFVSLSNNPLDNNQTIYDSWMFIEGLLKTIRTACPSIASVRFLVEHAPLTHQHLDFSNAWPATGFLAA